MIITIAVLAVLYFGYHLSKIERELREQGEQLRLIESMLEQFQNDFDDKFDSNENEFGV